MTELNYLRSEGGISLGEYKALSAEDRDTLKAWAREEAEVRGIALK